ncbi:MAG TPA: hypothetical protein VF531_10615, partial [Bacillota bacterium]
MAKYLDAIDDDTVNSPGGLGDQSLGQDDPLFFRIREGNTENLFYRNGPVAAHILCTSGEIPKMIVAFPAGNSGLGIWFKGSGHPVDLRVCDPMREIQSREGLFGVRFAVEASAPELILEEGVLGSIRVIRDFATNHHLDDALKWVVKVTGQGVRAFRDRLDGKCRYETEIKPGRGTVIIEKDGLLVFQAPQNTGNHPIRFTLTVLCGERPLTPIPAGELLKEEAGTDERLQKVLTFLSYDEKLAAGSWRFLTYFGRDTELSLVMLMPALKSRGIEAGLSSLIERLNDYGEVAHEEEIGEFAVIRHAGDRTCDKQDTPIYDYKMIDDDLLLAPLLARFFIDCPQAGKSVGRFLDKTTICGRSYRDAVFRNLSLVLSRARSFAQSPSITTLLALKANETVGNWRDSANGLGGGKIPYDVNVALMPVALQATAGLFARGLFGPKQDLADQAIDLAKAWQEAGDYFKISVPKEKACQLVREYAITVGVPAEDAVASIDRDIN